MAMRHTASFLQTFHTAQTAAQRTAESGTETPGDKIDTDPAALAFVKGQKVTAMAPRPAAGEMIEVKGWKVLTGPSLTTEPQAKFMIGIATSREGITDAMIDSLKTRLEQGFARKSASEFISRYKDLPWKRREPSAAMMEAVAPGASTEEYVKTQQPMKVEKDGIYVDSTEGRIFKVQFNKGSGDGRRLYAKQLVIELPSGIFTKDLLNLDTKGLTRDDISRTWSYMAGLVHRIKPEWKLTAEQADRYGALYGSCMRCGRDLTKESSIRSGMGDKCAGKSGF